MGGLSGLIQLAVQDSQGGCIGCPYDRANFVSSSLSADSPLLIISDYPSRSAKDSGCCDFAGIAGGYLQRLLKVADIPENQISLATLLRCIPMEVNTTAKSISFCANKFIPRMLNELSPKAVLLLGSSAFSYFFPKSKFNSLAGNFKVHDQYKIPFLATHHPREIVQAGGVTSPTGGSIYKTLSRDLVKMKKYLSGDLFSDRDYVLVKTKEEAKKWADHLVTLPSFCVDIETTSLRTYVSEASIQTISFGFGPGKQAVCYPLFHKDIKDLQFVEYCAEQIKRILACPAQKIGHNIGKFDIPYLKSQGFDIECSDLIDTMQMVFLLNEETRDLSLKANVAKRLDGYSNIVDDFENTNLSDMALYNNEDTDNNYRLAAVLCKDADRIDSEWASDKENKKVWPLRRLQQQNARNSIALGYMEEAGMFMDLKGSVELRKKYEEEVERLLTPVREEMEGKNPDSNKDLCWLFYDKLGHSVKARTPKGAPSVDKHALNALAEEEDCALAKNIMEARGYQKLISSYLDTFPKKVDVDGRLHANFWFAGTVTGRLSCSDPPLQTIPRKDELRSLFCAEEGNLLIAADFSQAELRVACSLADDLTMIQAYMEGKDVHRLTASKIAGVSYDKVSGDARQGAKPVNFGLLYGASAFRLKIIAKQEYGVIFSDEEAEEYRRIYFDTYYGLPNWHRDVTNELMRNGMVRSQFGRLRHLPNIYHPDEKERAEAKRMAINFTDQSASNEMNLMVLSDCQLHFVETGMKARVVSTIHDSIIIEAPREEVPECVEIIQAAVDRLKFDWLKVDMKMDISIGERWSKYTMTEL